MSMQGQVIGLLKRFLLPKAKQWYRNYKAKKAQQEGGGGGGGGGGGYGQQQQGIHSQQQSQGGYGQQQQMQGGYGGQSGQGGQQWHPSQGAYNGGQQHSQQFTQSNSHAVGPHHPQVRKSLSPARADVDEMFSHVTPFRFLSCFTPRRLLTLTSPHATLLQPTMTAARYRRRISYYYGTIDGTLKLDLRTIQNQDMINASNEHYVSLRNQAITEGNLMGACFDKAHRAHDQGDGAGAKRFADEGHQHQANKTRLNEQASQWIFNENNKNSPPNTIDLHGLFVQEAIERTEQSVQQAQNSGAQQLRIIVGKGIHSPGHQAKIKPAIEGLMQKYNLSAHLDPHNAGVLIVMLQGGGQGSRDAGFVDHLSRQQDNDCVVM
ncbi:uncharacterized protein L969DRAFT_152013 [Mixia osmundae IAM 14324]|uniref:uncharacterized protein n=1 Tax=Mixia osmundae (strain CBS 9802 / IAM 14324 / JCM 22182 / KY 12970) TaxID=764103 RepID=UPI0004A551E9|nr:uncharacterized protein L969DRAFT_152013 [Mixia osmundae IAM 14324]KEI42445.1 hypothetical protein L969DRAFT_152013 [Mixia osmundae IAM 14324]